MKSFYLFFLLAGLVSLLIACGGENETGKDESEKQVGMEQGFPEILAVDPVRGFEPVDPAIWSNRVMFVNYWAEWCKPCIKEIPELNELHASSDELVVVGYNFDGLQQEDLEKVAVKFGVRFPLMLKDPARLYKGFPDIDALPVTVVIDARGEVKKVLRGPQTFGSLQQMYENVINGG
jgi:thiol-disulfide isomerase/thioredoxin